MSILTEAKEYKITRYSADDKSIWNNFIDSSINGTFLFRRSFMDYHSDRFQDNSYLIWEKASLVAVFVAGVAKAALNQSVLLAHPGLTYGGLVYEENLKYYQVQKIYDELLQVIKADGFSQIIIKPVARVFCRTFSEAQLFYFYSKNFSLLFREINSVIDLSSEIQMTRARKKNLRKAESLGLKIIPSHDCEAFYNIMVESLKKNHGVQPAHSLSELHELMASNSDNIKHYVAILDDQVVGGTFLFLDYKNSFVHTQYTHANDAGRDARAIDALVMNTIKEAKNIGLAKLSFGISTVHGELNPGLLSQKEDFGSYIELIDVYEKML